jgi:hypothetical protein
MIALNATIATRVTPKVREGGEGDEREGDGRFDDGVGYTRSVG